MNKNNTKINLFDKKNNTNQKVETKLEIIDNRC